MKTVKRGYQRRLSRFLPCALLAFSFLTPLAAALWLISSYGVNVFWLDGWQITDLLAGPFRSSELFSQYNEHLYVLPRLAAMATGYDSVSQMYLVALALALAASLVVLSAGLSGWRLLWAAPVPAFLLGFRHQENLLWGNQMSFAFALCLSLGALYAAGTRAWYLGIPLALGATLSAAQGLFAWPAGLLVLALARRRGGAVAWALSGVAVWAWYLGRSEGAASTVYPLSHPLEALEYLVVLAGSVFSEGAVETLPWVGAGVLALSGLALWYTLGENSRLTGMILYGLLCLASITVGRVELGIYQGCCPATASRYAAFSAVLLAASYAALASAHGGGRRLPGIMASLVLVASLYGITVSYQEGLSAAADSHENRALYRESVRRDIDPAGLSEPYAANPNPTAVIQRAGVNAFADRQR